MQVEVEKESKKREKTADTNIHLGGSPRQFMVCPSCLDVISYGNLIRHNTPIYFYDHKTGEVAEVPRDDLAVFFKKHADHNIEDLVVIDGPVSRQKFIQLGDKYYNVEFSSNGTRGQRYILKCSRQRIEDPLQYEILCGQFKVWVDKIEAPDPVQLSKQIIKENPNASALACGFFMDSIKFILSAQESQIREELTALETLFDQGAASLTDHPLIIQLALNDLFLFELRNTIDMFPADDRFFFLKFVDEQNKPDGLLALKIVLDFSLPNGKEETKK